MLNSLIAGCLLVPLMADWSYDDETGPDRWASLDPEWASNVGDRQSPIDLSTTAGAGFASLELHHEHAASRVTSGTRSLRIDVDGNQGVVFGGAAYSLDHTHFHAASEHSVDGELARAEAHLVHTDANGRLLVLGVLIEAGSASDGIQGALDGATSFDPTLLLPGRTGSFWTYSGSLTTPPLSEGVTWVVFTDRLSASEEQLAQLEGICDGNRRPVQPRNGRRVELVGGPT